MLVRPPLVDENSTDKTYFHKRTAPCSSSSFLSSCNRSYCIKCHGQQYPFLAFAQEELGIPDTDTDTTTTTMTDNATEGTTTTTTASADNATTSDNKLAGIIASLQLAPYRLAPEWVTAGYWEIESDMPLLGGNSETQPTVTNFNGIVEMTRLSDGTGLHTHTLSDFRQSDVASTGGNTTTISGTMTVSLMEGPVENVPVFITLQNNLLSIAMDPEATHEHFGPTPIMGMILAPEHLQQISNLLTPTAAAAAEGTEGGGAEEGGAGTETPGQQDSTSIVTDTIGNTTGQ